MTVIKQQSKYSRCPICHTGEQLIPVFKKNGLPKYVLERHFSRESALNAEIGNVDFYFCQRCLFAFNKAFDPLRMDYLVDYESSRSHSGYFNNYLYSICREINAAFPVAGKTLVEIGSGDGNLLIKLRELFEFEGWGFEPSLSKTKKKLAYKDLKFIGDYYKSEVLNKKPDLLILRHILEHQGAIHKFLENILLKQKLYPSEIYIEVPAWEWIVANNHAHAFSYEHCSYFSKNSLRLTMELYGYECNRFCTTFNSEYMQYFGKRHANYKFDRNKKNKVDFISKKNRKSIINQTNSFVKKIPEILQRLKLYFKNGNDVVLCGAAGKGTMLLNILEITYKQLSYVVDSNPRRHNNYIPITGQKIISLKALKKLKPKYVLITNKNYKKEIELQLKQLNVKTKVKIIE